MQRGVCNGLDDEGERKEGRRFMLLISQNRRIEHKLNTFGVRAW